MTIYKAHHQKMMDRNNDCLYIIFSNDFVKRSNDTEFPFRQDSNFYYLTGFLEPETILVISGKENKSHLFLRENNPQEELWLGTRMGLTKAKRELEIDSTHDILDFNKKLIDLLKGHTDLYVDMLGHKEKFQTVQHCLDQLSHMRKVKEGFPQRIHSLSTLMGEYRSIKDEHEVLLMTKAAQISAQTHTSLMKITRPGINERDLHYFIDYYFSKNGSEHSAYENIVAGGNNANILHYNNNNEDLKDGDLVLIDAGCEYGLYASDITRTFPVNGKFSPAQAEIYDLVLKVQKSCIDMIRPGITIKDLHEFSARELSIGLIELGLLNDDIETIMKDGIFKEFYPHGLGHWIGMDVHDPCPYYNENRNDIKLKEGMLLTVEPGLYLNSNNENVPDKYKGIGIRIEDDILVTNNSCTNLTKDVVKEREDIEKVCAEVLVENLLTK